jgi:hypothetical protein
MPSTRTLFAMLSATTAVLLLFSSSTGLIGYFNSSAQTGNLSITSSYTTGGSLVGMFILVQQSGQTIASGYTPVSFALSSDQTYTITAEDYTNAYFYQWSDNVCSPSRSVTLSSGSQTVLNAGYTTTAQAAPNCGSSTGITVYASRIPASYWAPCFATVCSAGTGPGATMWFALLDSSGNIIQTAFSDENGYTFTGLTPGATYYVYPGDCGSCHGSTHDVIFEYWGNNLGSTRPLAVTVGESLDAWYSCTNGCAGG